MNHVKNIIVVNVILVRDASTNTDAPTVINLGIQF